MKARRCTTFSEHLHNIGRRQDRRPSLDTVKEYGHLGSPVSKRELTGDIKTNVLAPNHRLKELLRLPFEGRHPAAVAVGTYGLDHDLGDPLCVGARRPFSGNRGGDGRKIVAVIRRERVRQHVSKPTRNEVLSRDRASSTPRA